MLKKVFFASIFLLIYFVCSFSFSDQVLAVCTTFPLQTATCTCSGCAGTCTADCEVVYGSAQYPNSTCFTSCYAANGVTKCTLWSGWGPCNGGWQEQYCKAPSGNTDMQVQSCTVAGGGGGGGGATPTPTPTPPGCVATNPTAVTLSSPADGASLTDLSVSLVWNATTAWGIGCPQDNRYNLYVDTINPPTTLVDTTTTTTSTFNAQPGTTYYWRVMTMNGTNAVYSTVRSFTTQAAITGTVYIDNDNTCSTAITSTLGGLSAKVRGTAYTSAVSSADGTYSISAPGGSYSNLDLLGIPAEYSCSTGCLQSCPTITSVNSQSSGNNFFISTLVSG
jgi:hypothetical protein